MKTTAEFKKPKSTKYEIMMGLRNVTVNVCGFTSGKMDSVFIGLFAKGLKMHSNLLHPCPYSVN